MNKALTSTSSPSPPPHTVADIQHGQVLNCVRAIQEYVTKAVSAVKGMKAMILDSQTTSIVGLVYSQSALIHRDVFLVEQLGVVSSAMEAETAEEFLMARKLRRGAIVSTEQVGINEQKMHHLTAIVIVQPNATTLQQLGVLLKSPRYNEYHIFFTNILPTGFLESLVDLDVNNFIHGVHEYYADFFAVTPSFFHFNADAKTAAQMLAANEHYASKSAWMSDRDLQGLLSLMLSLKKRPDIRYLAGSAACKKLAYDLVHVMQSEQELFTFHQDPTLLLLLDRREDAVTPLLTQWTYQAMVHELLGIEHNRVNLNKDATTASDSGLTSSDAHRPTSLKSREERSQDALHDVVLSSESDEFFRTSMFANFGELGIRIKKLVAEFQAATKTQSKLETIEDMQRFVDNYPQFKLQSGTVSKHVSVMGEISKAVNQRKLLTVSAAEQEIVCGTEHDEAYEKLMRVMEDREIHVEDKLRCVMLYALRYAAHTSSNLPTLLSLLRAHARVSGYSDRIVEAVDRLLAYNGSHSRTWPLFGDADSNALSLKNVVKSIQSNVRGVDNIYTQHRSLMYEMVPLLMAGELKTSHFPFVEAGNPRTIYRRIIVYMVGGVTYEEYTSIESLLASPRFRHQFTAIVGGSCIHNSRTFLDDVIGVPLQQYKMTEEERRREEFNYAQTTYTTTHQPAPYYPPPPSQSQSQSSYTPKPQYSQQQQPYQPQQYYPQQRYYPPSAPPSHYPPPQQQSHQLHPPLPAPFRSTPPPPSQPRQPYYGNQPRTSYSPQPSPTMHASASTFPRSRPLSSSASQPDDLHQMMPRPQHAQHSSAYTQQQQQRGPAQRYAPAPGHAPTRPQSGQPLRASPPRNNGPPRRPHSAQRPTG